MIIINKILKDFIDYKKQLENDLLNAEDNMFYLMKGISDREQKEIITHLYFNDLIVNKKLQNFLGHNFKMGTYCNEYKVNLKCFSCNKIKETVALSRSDLKVLKSNFVCAECVCKEKEERENDHIKRKEQSKSDAIKKEKYKLKLKNMPYKEYLNTEHWKSFRNKIVKYANYKCQMCDSKGTLNVHHRNYDCRGREEYRDVIVLCADCHSKFHDKKLNALYK